MAFKTTLMSRSRPRTRYPRRAVSTRNALRDGGKHQARFKLLETANRLAGTALRLSFYEQLARRRRRIRLRLAYKPLGRGLNGAHIGLNGAHMPARRLAWLGAHLGGSNGSRHARRCDLDGCGVCLGRHHGSDGVLTRERSKPVPTLGSRIDADRSRVSPGVAPLPCRGAHHDPI